ncbi:hypothetical protein PR202_gb03326 [Eleusine coracana subsp. coracana]|uniref:Methyltransferase type 11 domain-containing protein n=1 Tax=Eleusine coracana subsp. coracana TaxID=191504 RepID=A0AAV5E1J1_ELECO|nr:hypothetical protein PR202_gb03246 [Eleusine coracana subsp. coracana]GJN16348.1 hypothetical protein PR202_gb03326 [Eleusine coracana subsp. coracana]
MAAALGTSTAPAVAAFVAPQDDHRRRPLHRVASCRRHAASTRWWILRASSSPSAVTTGAPDEAAAEPLAVEPAPETKLNKLACPICYYPLASSSDQSALECSTCKKAYPNKQEYWDLTVAVGSTEYSESMPAATEMFRTLALVRADISRLPFVSSSIDAVHAGAALHCWPSPACAVAEISRVLRPGGIFVASTFILDVVPPAIPALRIGRPYISQITGNNTFLSEVELEDLCRACGLVGFKCIRNGFFIMLSATKAT